LVVKCPVRQNYCWIVVPEVAEHFQVELTDVRMIDDNIEVMHEEQQESWIIIPPVSSMLFFVCCQHKTTLILNANIIIGVFPCSSKENLIQNRFKEKCGHFSFLIRNQRSKLTGFWINHSC
jgi:hypothetical protein